MRLHGLKVWCEKCVPVLPLVQRAGPTCGEEGRVRHAKKTKYGPQIRLHEIERSHLRLGVDPPTLNRRLPRSRTTITERLPILAIFLDGN